MDRVCRNIGGLKKGIILAKERSSADDLHTPTIKNILRFSIKLKIVLKIFIIICVSFIVRIYTLKVHNLSENGFTGSATADPCYTSAQHGRRFSMTVVDGASLESMLKGFP